MYSGVLPTPARLKMRFLSSIKSSKMDSREQVQHQRVHIPERGPNHGESTILLSSFADKRDDLHAPLSTAEWPTTRCTQSRAAEVAKIGWAETHTCRHTYCYDLRQPRIVFCSLSSYSTATLAHDDDGDEWWMTNDGWWIVDGFARQLLGWLAG